MEVSVAAGLSHISSFLDQPVVIVDGSGNEDTFLLKSAREHAEYSWKTLIELPSNGDQTLRWLTRLSASALKYVLMLRVKTYALTLDSLE